MKKAKLIDGKIWCTFPYDLDNLKMATAMFIIKGLKTIAPYEYLMPLTQENVEVLITHNFEVSDELMEFLLQTKKESKKVIETKIEGLKGELFEYQKEGVAFMQRKNGRVLLADSQGLGKTAQALAYLQRNPSIRPAIVVCPASLKLNWKAETEKWTEIKAEVVKGTKPYAVKAELVIINYDIVHEWVETLRKIGFKALVLDECFIAGTRISTPKGIKNIEDLQVGELVYNAIGIGKIENIGRRKTDIIVNVYLNNGTIIRTTPNHPFFTPEGWISAANLKENQILFDKSDILNILHNKRTLKNIHYKKNTNYENLRMVRRSFLYNRKKKKVLQSILLSEMEDDSNRLYRKTHSLKIIRRKVYCLKEGTCKSSRDGTSINREIKKYESREKTNDSREAQKTLGKIWTSIKQNTTQRREWSAIARSSANLVCSTGRRMESRICNFNQTTTRFRLSNLLQGRPCTSIKKSMDRIGWMEAQHSRTTDERQKEGRSFNEIRVERIEIQESRSNGESSDCFVYNLQVSGHPSYYAESVLVHNCVAIKESTARRTKAVKRLAKGIPHVIALSGTPILNRPSEIFNTVRIINPDMFPSPKDFLRRYCDMQYNGFGWSYSGATHIPELHRILTSTIMLRRLKEDVLKDLPPKLFSFVPIEIDNETEYRKAESDFIEYIREKKGDEKALKMERAKQFAQVETLKQLSVQGKIKACIDWVDNLLEVDGKLVVFCSHHFVIDKLMERFKDVAVKLDGRDTMIEKNKAVERFQNEDKIRLFVGNIKAAGVGLTLTASSNVAFMEYPWSPADLAQCADRCHRIGQKDTVNVYYLHGNNTIEERLIKILDRKKLVLDALLDGIDTQEENLLTEIIKSYI